MREVEMLKSQYGQTNQILDSQDRAQYANENRQNRNFNLLSDGIKDQGASTRDTVYRTSATVIDNVVKGASENLLATERVGSHIDDNVYRTAAAIDQSVYRSQTALGDQIAQIGLEGQKNTKCPECGSELKTLFYPPGIHFNGSGFYKTSNKDKKL